MEELYADKFVRIVKPGSPGSVSILTEVGWSLKTNIEDVRKVCKTGLRTYNHIQQKPIGTPLSGWPDPHKADYIYFRAPYTIVPPNVLDGKTVDERIKESYKLDRQSILLSGFISAIVTIDVDPANTFVYHDVLQPLEKYWKKGIRLSEYDGRYGEEGEILVFHETIPPEWFSSCMFLTKDYPSKLKGDVSALPQIPYPPEVKFKKDGTPTPASKSIVENYDRMSKEHHSRFLQRVKWANEPGNVYDKVGGKRRNKTRRHLGRRL